VKVLGAADKAVNLTRWESSRRQSARYRTVCRAGQFRDTSLIFHRRAARLKSLSL